MRSQVTYFFFAWSILLIACSRTVVEPENPGYDYFPLEEGNWIAYQVDSTVHDDDLGIHESFTYQVKELVDSAFTDNEGEQAFMLKRFKRATDTLPWVLSDVWTTKRNAFRAERVEENVRLIRLVFPARPDKEWNTNAENTREEWESEIVEVGNSSSIDGNSFQDVCEVLIHENLNAIEGEIAEAIYARDIGLIYFRLDTVRFNGFYPGIGQNWSDSLIDIGREFEMRYLEHGVE
ncbi:MAG: hypothetical protein AAF487_12550 [Bacteroidota bacterium]